MEFELDLHRYGVTTLKEQHKMPRGRIKIDSESL